MFKVGDLAVYPAHGVGRIVSIEERNISGEKKIFYVLEILEKGMKIMVPQDSVHSSGLRDLTPPEKTSKVFKILRQKIKIVNHQNWTKRFREYQNKIRRGSLFEVAEVLRDIHLLSLQKDLSFGERKMLEFAKNLLVQELSITLSKSEEEIARKIDKCLNTS